MPGLLAAAAGPACERVADGVLDEPVAAVTSLAFVVAGVVVLVLGRRTGAARGAPAGRSGSGAAARGGLAVYAGLVAATGVGSFVQHGPDPAWSDVAHDLPLLATLAYVGADAAADLASRPRARRWWLPVVATLLPLVVLAPRAGDLAGVGLAVVAVGLTVLRALRRPAVRTRVAVTLGLLVTGSAIGTLSRAGWPWCDPASLLQGHGGWHVLAAAALAVLAPTLGHPSVGPR